MTMPRQQCAGIGRKTIATDAETTLEPFACDFGFKSTPVETEVDGVKGLVLKGYASLFNEIDQSGEHQTPTSFDDIEDSWGRHEKPPVWWQHGLEPPILTSQVGYALKHSVDDKGLYVEAFVPEDQGFKSKDAGQKAKRWAEIYRGIKSGRINGFSIGGTFLRWGKSLLRWSVSELTITDRPCLDQARFAIGTKALMDRYGTFGLPTSGDADDMGADSAAASDPPPILTRPHWTQAMGLAQGDKDAGLHDHLMNRPPEVQGSHDPGSCAICTPRRGAMGMKSDGDPGEQDSDPPDGEDEAGDDGGGAKATAETGGKATVLKKDSDGLQHPASHYLYTPDTKVSDWKLQVKHTDKEGYDRTLCGNAHAALTVGYRGNKVEGVPKAEMLAKLKKIYAAQGWDWPEDDAAESGGKSAADALLADRPDLVYSALALLTEFEHGEKIGRKHSKKDREVIRGIVAVLGSHFLADDPDHDGDDDSGDTDDAASSPSTPLAAAGAATGS